MHHLGHTRSTSQPSHLLHTPDAFVRTRLPGMENAFGIVHVSAAAGARFTQYSAEFEASGKLGSASGQRFVYVLEGDVVVEAGGKEHSLTPGGYAYLPEGVNHQVTSAGAARAAVIEKPYQKLIGTPAPEPVFGREESVESKPLMGDEDLQVRSLLPDLPSFDFAVNTMVYLPGAGLSMVEVHVMEHGLLMLEGGGIYRLGESWYPVKEGDFIWMAAYCPQWFGAIGKKPARYLIYKDWNRSPTSDPR